MGEFAGVDLGLDVFRGGIEAAAALTATYAADTVSDPYFVAFSAFAEHPADRHYLAQNEVLLKLIGDATGTRG